MLQGPFSVPWAPYQDPTIEKASAAEHMEQEGRLRMESKDGAEQSMEQEAGNEKADQDGAEQSMEQEAGNSMYFQQIIFCFKTVAKSFMPVAIRLQIKFAWSLFAIVGFRCISVANSLLQRICIVFERLH
ncbi:hypothetical protein Tco_0308015 [Tanacetum coccineum]